jgi:RNA polymerase sigma-70 factor, ECF subfamily
MLQSNREDSSFEAQVREHHIRVRAFVRTLGVEADWVDDIAQEAFLKAYLDWESFDKSRDFGKWVRGIAANIVRNEIRKQARRNRILNTDLVKMLLLEKEGKLIDRPHLPVEALKLCLAKLNPLHRRVVELRYREGFSAPEIAEKTENSSVSIRQMLLRIRRQLRLCIEKQMIHEA